MDLDFPDSLKVMRELDFWMVTLWWNDGHGEIWAVGLCIKYTSVRQGVLEGISNEERGETRLAVNWCWMSWMVSTGALSLRSLCALPFHRQVNQTAPPFTAAHEGAGLPSGERNRLQTDTKQLQQKCPFYLPLLLTKKQEMSRRRQHK